MDKYIGFDVSSKKTVACVLADGQKDVYETLPTDPKVMRAMCLTGECFNERLVLEPEQMEAVG